MLKNIIKIVFLFLFANNVYSQVGVGTASPITSSALDITSTNKGVLIPRVELISLAAKTPLTGNIPDGTMVFNTKKNGTGVNSVFPGVYVWKLDRWYIPAEITSAKSVKFSNSSTNTNNFNPATVAAPAGIDIFNTAVFNDDTAIYEKINNYQLRIKQSGLYLVSANLALKQDPAVDNSRLSNYIYFNLNGSLASAKVITLVPQYDPRDVDIDGRFAFGLNSYMNVTAGSILTLHSQRYKNGTNYNGIINFDNASLSSVVVVKIQ
ncbi:hypothetical protein HHL23_22165 [Chryseobacterium sp. RP-3-3]|uniref:C1q domain-containing protein n=1 Tax=Chryseobacterium antibioticum TaxID=2728847 RepID=A0A7Y0AS18_9FLAO|nr:hypothetical protein [Chryseobacterium antibioticum]NML72460.1 hypothetical protein [Chryseobacterium antibioticum]